MLQNSCVSWSSGFFAHVRPWRRNALASKTSVRRFARLPRIICFLFHLPERPVNGARPAKFAVCFGASVLELEHLYQQRAGGHGADAGNAGEHIEARSQLRIFGNPGDDGLVDLGELLLDDGQSCFYLETDQADRRRICAVP